MSRGGIGALVSTVALAILVPWAAEGQTDGASSQGPSEPTPESQVQSVDLLSGVDFSDSNYVKAVIEHFTDAPSNIRPILIDALSDNIIYTMQELVEGLSSGNAVIRRSSAQAIAAAGTQDQDAINALANLVSSDPDEAVRGASAEALRSAGPSASSVAPSLLAALGDESQWVRCVAVEALGNLGKNSNQYISAIEILAESDPDIYVREQARKSLDSMSVDRSGVSNFDLAINAESPLGLVKSAREKVSAGSFDSGIAVELGTYYLSAIVPSEQVTTYMSHALLLPDDNVAHIPAEDKKASLIIRGQAIEGLRDMGEDAAPALPYLIVALGDDSVWVRAVAAEVIGNIGTPARLAIPQLGALLGDPDEHVRDVARVALAGALDANTK